MTGKTASLELSVINMVLIAVCILVLVIILTNL